MNKRRAANRAESQRNASGGDAGEDYGRNLKPGEHDYGNGHRMVRRSHASKGEIMGPGPVEGAGEVGGAGPGKAAGRYLGLPPVDDGPREPASGATPKGESRYAEE